jgi:uncharacterized protein (TIGR03067 family)
MICYSSLLIVAGLLVAAEPQKGDDQKIEGTWRMVRGEEDGKSLPAEVVHSARLKIEGDKHTVRVGDATLVGTHRLEPNEKPKIIETMDTEGPFKGETLHGIYQLRGNEFTVCFAAPGKERPTKFTTKSGTGHLLHVWRRHKE